MTKLRLVHSRATRRETRLGVLVIAVVLVLCLIFSIEPWW
jgi:hypothetical protein